MKTINFKTLDILIGISTIILLITLIFGMINEREKIKTTCENNYWYDKILYNNYDLWFSGNEEPYKKESGYKSIMNEYCYLFDMKNNKIIEKRTSDEIRRAIQYKEKLEKSEKEHKDLIDNLKLLGNQK